MYILFLFSFTSLLYVFIGYPLFLYIVSLFVRKIPKKEAYHPSVSLIISAYNEESVIRWKIENTLAINYPKDKLEIIVCSDGSTDKTYEIVREYENKGIKLFTVNERVGKNECQNQAVKIAKNEILVFSDANSLYEKNAILELVSNFADSSVGVVCGELRYAEESGSDEAMYWNLEKFLKERESSIGSCLGANGAIYAIPHMLYRDVPRDCAGDFIEPFLIYREGHRVVYERRAFCVENSDNNKYEFKRKKRILLGSIQGLYLIKDFLNPFVYGWYSLALWSHKILRWFGFVPLMLLFVSNIFLLVNPVFYIFFIIQVLFYVFAFLGIYIDNKIFSVPYYFVMNFIASIVATYELLIGRRLTTWEVVRS